MRRGAAGWRSPGAEHAARKARARRRSRRADQDDRRRRSEEPKPRHAADRCHGARGRLLAAARPPEPDLRRRDGGRSAVQRGRRLRRRDVRGPGRRAAPAVLYRCGPARLPDTLPGLRQSADRVPRDLRHRRPPGRLLQRDVPHTLLQRPRRLHDGRVLGGGRRLHARTHRGLHDDHHDLSAADHHHDDDHDDHDRATGNDHDDARADDHHVDDDHIHHHDRAAGHHHQRATHDQYDDRDDVHHGRADHNDLDDHDHHHDDRAADHHHHHHHPATHDQHHDRHHV